MHKPSLFRVACAAGTLALSLAPFAARAAVTEAFSAGDLIKGTSTSAVYYFATDGRRYVFPNEKTYFTWYKDFSTVKTIPDRTLGTIPLGRSNVTYRPGYKMVKITTDPKVYAVDQGGMLRLISTENLALTLYGINWKNRIDDVADAFFVNYRVGMPITEAPQYNPSNVLTGTPTISIDKQMDETMVTVSIASVSNGYVPSTTTIKAGKKVTWVNNDIVPHTVTGPGFDSGILNPGQSYSRVFASAGSFNYHCSIHSAMQGTINVVP